VGAEQDGGEGAADEVGAGAPRYRPVEHLRGEDARRDEAQQRRPRVGEFAVDAPRRIGEGGYRRQRADGRDRQVEKAVGDVHTRITGAPSIILFLGAVLFEPGTGSWRPARNGRA
jgi:hypothetical protein